MSRVVHFEFSADDPERAKAFFENVFGWRFEKWEGGGAEVDYWMVSTDAAGEEGEPGINGGMGTRPQMSSATVNTIGVDDVGAVLAKAEAAGAEITMPKSAIPGVGWVGYFKDPEGNMWGAFKDDTQAA